MKKRLRNRIWIIIAIMIIVSFSDWSFAAGNDEPVRVFAFRLNFLTQILSRIWVIFAKVAWEFLTNKRVYWEVLWLDALLWKYRVVVRNIANFWLWLFFTYTIFTALFKKEDILKNFKNILLRLLIAWVWIQTSRFFTAVIMDISTITLVSVWSFPAQIIAQSSESEESLNKSLTSFLEWNTVVTWEQIILFPTNGTANGFIQEMRIPMDEWSQIEREHLLDDFLPKYDDVSWPLYYMWIVILDSFSIESIPVQDTGKQWWEKTILNTIIDWWTTIVFSIEMMVLCIVALLRIFYLWMFIVLSPIAVLFYCIKKADWNNVWKFISENFKSLKNINISSFLANAFKPTIIVLWMSISIVFIAAMKWTILKKDNIDLQWVSLSSHCLQTKKCDTQVDSEFFAWVFKNFSNTFMKVILSIITVILFYQIIKISVNIGKWEWKNFVFDKIEGLQKNIWELISSTPIIPVTWRDATRKETSKGHISLKNAWRIPGEKLRRETYEIESKTTAQSDEIRNARFGDNNRLSDSEKLAITNARTNTSIQNTQKLEAMTDVIKKIRTDNTKNIWKWMVLNPNAPDQFWRWEFTQWLNNRVTNKDYSNLSPWWKNLINDWGGQDLKNAENRSLETLFKNKQNYIHEYLEAFLDSGDPRINSTKTWTQLMNVDISHTEP